MLKKIFLILFLFASFYINSQSRYDIKKGIVLSYNDSISLPYINIYDETYKIGTVTNEMGAFLLEMPDSLNNSEITFSAIGFLTKKIRFNSIPDTVFLTPSTEVLDEIQISNITPKFEKIVDSIYANLKKNYSNKRHLLNAFYRQTVIKDSAYLRIIEADVNMQEYGIKKPLSRDRIKVNYYRRSDNNRTQRHNRLWKIFKSMSSYITGTTINEVARIQRENFINHFSKTKEYNIYYKNLIKSYVFDYEYTTFINNEPVYVFTFYGKSLEGIELNDEQISRIYVNSNDYAVIKYEKVDGYKKGNDFKKSGKTIINYTKIGDYYYLTSISDNFNSKSTGLIINKLHTYQVFTDRKNYEKIKRKEAEDKKNDFGERKYEYDSIFWKKYKILEEVPLNIKLKSYTEKNKSLGKQYLENATEKKQ